MEVARIRVEVALRLRPLVAKLEEPEWSGLADDRAADLLAYLANQGVEDGLRSLSTTARQNVRAVLVEYEDRPTWPGQDSAGRHNELERRLLIGQKTREPERSDSPDHGTGRDRDELVYPAQ